MSIKSYIVFFVVLLFSVSCVGQPSSVVEKGRARQHSLADKSGASLPTASRYRFHCDGDTLLVEQLLAKGLQSGIEDSGEMMAFYAQQLLGTPYVAHTLEGPDEQLVINLHQLDCTTFVEALYALTRATLAKRSGWKNFADELENLRYRRGQMTDYASRLHYICDWYVDNHDMGNIDDITPELPDVKYELKTINYMTTHRADYLSLKNDDAMTEKIKRVESGYIRCKYPYVPKNYTGTRGFKEGVQPGDIVAMVTNKPGIDVSHLGIVYKDAKGEVFLLNASSIGKKVQIEKVPLQHTLSRSKTNKGVRIFRLTKRDY